MERNINPKIIEFLRESNAIEDVTEKKYGIQPLEDAIDAWRYAYNRKENISLEDILTIHRKLLRNLEPGIAGIWRNCDVWIGSKYKKFHSREDIISRVGNWHESYFYSQSPLDLQPILLEQKVRESHVIFEDIHPFIDGNGRTGRILWQIQRINSGLPIKIIHHGREQIEYYKWFQ